MTPPYTTDYYANLREGSRASAEVVVPLVIDLIRPKSVVDVGCGIGAWPAAFKRHGITEVCGIDGAYIERQQLEIEQREFLTADLTQPLNIEQRFDLAISLEVAEHLPERLASQFVNSLTKLAPVVLFSAAVPHQGGENHVNEQWPAYWVQRFAAQGFAALDPFRRLIWQRSSVEWWYAQNMLLFVRLDQLPKYLPVVSKMEQAFDHREILPLIHPRNYQQHTWQNLVLKFAVDLATVVPVGQRLILVDDNRFGTIYLLGRDVVPFLERDGAYAGPPCDDEQSICELRHMQNIGVTFMAFGWPSFWWLAHYPKFAAHLNKYHTCVLQNDRLILYSLLHSSDPE